MANRTGSRICSGSPNQKPVTAFTQTDYDAALTSGPTLGYTLLRQ